MMVAFTETKEFSWLFLAANRLRPTSVRNKLAKIRPSYAIADVGIRLMQQAEEMVPNWHRPPALIFRDGLVVALLAYRPVRLANLANIRIGQHLIEAGDGYRISFSAEETKQGKVLSFDVPQSLVPQMRRYIETYRPALIASGWHGAESGNLLWISRDGGPLTSPAIGDLIKRRTKAAFGSAINPHLFRDCAATTIATDEPGRAHVIPGVLGHSSPTTSERHYNQARMTEAAERYHHVVEKRRRRKPRAA
jgi:integrase/recombinase XerD